MGLEAPPEWALVQVTVDQGSRTNLIQTASLTLIESSMAVGTLANENVTALLVSILPTNDVDTAGLGEKVCARSAPPHLCALSLHDGVTEALLAVVRHCTDRSQCEAQRCRWVATRGPVA